MPQIKKTFKQIVPMHPTQRNKKYQKFTTQIISNFYAKLSQY